MYISKNNVIALQSSQIAYPVGANKDSYTILSWFKEDLLTGVTSVKHELFKNQIRSTKELLHTGTYSECVDIVKSIVLKEGEWRQIPDKPFEKELMFTV